MHSARASPFSQSVIAILFPAQVATDEKMSTATPSVHTEASAGDKETASNRELPFASFRYRASRRLRVCLAAKEQSVWLSIKP
jgi:hypothetical protein